MRRATMLAFAAFLLLMAFPPAACSNGGQSYIGVGAPCFDPAANDGGGASLGTCDPTASFCYPGQTANSKFTCLARPSTPFITSDTLALQFNGEFNGAVYVGTSIQNSLQIFNQGQSDLTINSLAVSGTNQSLFVAEFNNGQGASTLPATVASRQEAYARVTYTPTQPETDTATLTIKSNGANTPPCIQPCTPQAGTLIVNLSAVAIPAPDGGTDAG